MRPARRQLTARGCAFGSGRRQQGGIAGWVLLLLLSAALLYATRQYWLPLLPAAWLDPSPAAQADGAPAAATVYAWQDDAGQWHYSDQPPTDRPFEVRQYRSDMNVVPAWQSREQ